MATIKTQLVGNEQRIITKGGLPSCTCCAAVCCMYPASQLGIGYAQADLPDAVTVNWTDRFTGSMSKSGSSYAGGGATLEIANGIWRLSDSNGTTNVGRCLIRGDGNLTQGDDLVEDSFADIYEIDVQSVGQTNELSRNSLCVWGGTQSNYLAYYDGNNSFIESYYSGPSHKWLLIRGSLQPDEGGGVWEKDDPQNGPEGNYSPSANAGDFAGIGTVTVSPV